MGLDYIINKTELYDAIDIVGKLLNFSEQKITKGGNRYIKCTIIDATDVERSLKHFGEHLVPDVH